MNESPDRPHPATRFRRGDILSLRIADLAEASKGFGRLDDGLGVFVEGPVAVGDLVEASIRKLKPRFLEADLKRVVEPSADRVSPDCAHFGVCGGCKWQHVDYAAQLELKRKLVRDALEHIGCFVSVDVRTTVGAASPFGYRNKVDFSFGAQRFLLEDELDAPRSPVDFALGFHRPGRFEKVIDIQRCSIATPLMNQVCDLTRRFFLARGTAAYHVRQHTGLLRNLVIRHAAHTGQCMVYLITSSFEPSLFESYAGHLREALGGSITTVVIGCTNRLSNVAYGEALHLVHGPGVIEERMGPFSFLISPNSFFQTNTAQAERLYAQTLEAAGLTGSERVLDLYCGTGTISLYLSRHAREVIGYEQEPSAVRDARANVDRNQCSNVRFVEMDLRHLAVPEGGPTEVVVTDPPRAGMHEDTVDCIRAMAPRRIVYVSCNPASLARDAQRLCAGGRYRLGMVTPVDLFPHTYHVESVAVLDRV